MSDFVSLGTVFLTGLVLASLQLPLGTLLLLYHASLGKNIRKTTRRLASSYLSGAMLASFLFISASCFLVSAFSLAGTLSRTSLSVLFGVLLSLGVVAWCFYYKRRGSTELWLPRRFARFLNTRAKSTSDAREGFSLGLTTVVAESLFAAPLFLVAGDAILRLSTPLLQALALFGLVLLSVLPLLVLRATLRSGRNVAEVQRWRLKNQTFFRIFSGAGFLVLAFFLLVFTILGGVA